MADATGVARPDRVVLGATLIVAAVFLMSLQDAVIKYASAALIYVLRGALAVPCLLGLALAGGAGVPGSRGRPGRWTILRSMLLVAMYVALYATVPVLSLSTIAAAFYTGPIFITLLSALLIGEPVGRRGWLAVGLGFLGVLCILRPGSDAFQPVALLPVLSGLFYALAAIITRSRCQHESAVTLAIALNVALLVTGGLAGVALALVVPADETVAAYPFLLGAWVAAGPQEWGLVAVLAVLIVGIGVGLAAAYQVAPPVVVATFDYSYLVFAALWSVLFFAEWPDGPTVAGMLLIVGGGLLVIRR